MGWYSYFGSFHTPLISNGCNPSNHALHIPALVRVDYIRDITSVPEQANPKQRRLLTISPILSIFSYSFVLFLFLSSKVLPCLHVDGTATYFILPE